jgi:hypothetical protein
VKWCLINKIALISLTEYAPVFVGCRTGKIGFRTETARVGLDNTFSTTLSTDSAERDPDAVETGRSSAKMMMKTIKVLLLE